MGSAAEMMVMICLLPQRFCEHGADWTSHAAGTNDIVQTDTPPKREMKPRSYSSRRSVVNAHLLCGVVGVQLWHAAK